MADELILAGIMLVLGLVIYPKVLDVTIEIGIRKTLAVCFIAYSARYFVAYLIVLLKKSL